MHNLKRIDFSDGIKAAEIDHNFNMIQKQLDKERISVAGAGVAYGLEFELNDFTLNIKQGCLINNEGQEVYIEPKTIQIEKPVLINLSEKRLVVDKFNRVFLSEIPYAKTRDTIAENVSAEESGITIFKADTFDKVPLASIDGKILNLKPIIGSIVDMEIDVQYSYTFKRRDILYLDKEFKMQYRQGITSPSPSVPSLDENEYSYVLGYIEVDGHAINKENKVIAKAAIIKDFKSVRNVYTDNDNKLYLCGTPFSSLKVIHLVEPKNPEENTFWYDFRTNKLKIWASTEHFIYAKEFTIETSNPNAIHKFKTEVPYIYNANQVKVYVNNILLSEDNVLFGSDLTEEQKREDYVLSEEFEIIKKLSKGDVVAYKLDRTDGLMSWVTINDTSYVDMEERKIWNPDDMEFEKLEKEHDMQHFFFNAVNDRACLFTPGKNCLEILIDQIPLHSDQFIEITMEDAIASDDAKMIKDKLINYYNYTDQFEMENVHEEYENIGIGFKLTAPLDKNSYVEVRVKQRVNTNPISKRFQRTATFVAEGTETYQQYISENNGTTFNPPIFKTSAQYRFDENQLEVFLNGRRLEKNVEWIEKKTATYSLKAVPCEHFEILPPAKLLNGDRVSHKVSTSIYSYDHVEMLLGDFSTRIQDTETIVKNTKKEIDAVKQNVESKIEIVENQIEQVTNITNNLEDTYIKKNEVIPNSSLSNEVMQGLMANSFYASIVVTQERSYDISNICGDKDFTMLFNLNDNNGNKILRRGEEDSDYNIVKQGNAINLILYSPSISEGHILYLSGIKFGL